VNADLLVVGAGPAGCAAAVAARRRAPSLRVVVVDSASFPREKPCGGAIPGGGLSELARAGLALRVPHVRVDHAVLRVGGRSTRVRLKRPAAVVHRREFDLDLVAQAREAGAGVLEESPLGSLRLFDGGGVATAGGREIRFRVAVAADGASGTSRRLLGLPPGRRVPLREVTVEGRALPDLLFDLDEGLPGYAWRFPSARQGRPVESVGVYSTEPAPALSGRLGAFVERERPGLELRPFSPEPWALRMFDSGGPVGAGPVLLAGDALGADPLAGEGIRYALWSGRTAGELAARARGGLLATSAGPGLLRGAYRLRLAASRSGLALELACRLAPRLYGPEAGPWRSLASDREVAEALADVVSGLPLPAPALRLASRYRALRRR